MRRGSEGDRELKTANIPTKLQLGPTYSSAVQPKIPHTHTHTRAHMRMHARLRPHTHTQPPTHCPWCPLFLRVCGYRPGASKAAAWLGSHSVHSPVGPAPQALFLRTVPLGEQKQMCAPSPLFLHLGSASSPPQILSHTQKNWNFSRNRWSGSFSPSSLLLRHRRGLRSLQKPDVYYISAAVSVPLMWCEKN